jgi:hypothetical protein
MTFSAHILKSIFLLSFFFYLFIFNKKKPKSMWLNNVWFSFFGSLLIFIHIAISSLICIEDCLLPLSWYVCLSVSSIWHLYFICAFNVIPVRFIVKIFWGEKWLHLCSFLYAKHEYDISIWICVTWHFWNENAASWLLWSVRDLVVLIWSDFFLKSISPTISLTRYVRDKSHTTIFWDAWNNVKIPLVWISVFLHFGR